VAVRPQVRTEAKELARWDEVETGDVVAMVVLDLPVVAEVMVDGAEQEVAMVVLAGVEAEMAVLVVLAEVETTDKQ